MLEKEIERIEKEIQHAANADLIVSNAAWVRFSASEDPQYLGPSSGITNTHLVIELAKQSTDSKKHQGSGP